MEPNRVDENVYARVVSQQDFSRAADFSEVAEVCDDDINRDIVLRHDFPADALRLLGVAADHNDMSAAAGKTLHR
jgi:hypothetical protein